MSFKTRDENTIIYVNIFLSYKNLVKRLIFSWALLISLRWRHASLLAFLLHLGNISILENISAP